MNFLVFGKADSWPVDSEMKIPLEYPLTVRATGFCFFLQWDHFLLMLFPTLGVLWVNINAMIMSPKEEMFAGNGQTYVYVTFIHFVQ